MYTLHCPTLDRDLRLERHNVLSAHRVGIGRVVYLRCACGATAMWSSAGTTLHPRPARDAADAA